MKQNVAIVAGLASARIRAAIATVLLVPVLILVATAFVLALMFAKAEGSLSRCGRPVQPVGGASEGTPDASGGTAGDPQVPLAPDGLSPQRIAELAMAAGFTGDEVPVAVAVALAESTGIPDRHNGPTEPGEEPLNDDGSIDYGLWQINDRAHGPSGFDPGRAFDVHYNAMWARRIYERAGGWGPWSAYNNDAYLEHLAVGQAAADIASPQDVDVAAIEALMAEMPTESADGVAEAQTEGLNCAPGAAQLINTGFPAEIDPYQPSEPQVNCFPVAQPGVVDFSNVLLTTYPVSENWGITRDCWVEPDRPSEHKEGRALDWGVNVSVPEQRAAAEDAINKLLATDEHGNPHALFRRFGLMYIIWNRQIFSSSYPDQGWRPYSCNGSPTSCHTDHVHFSFSWAGASKQTTWWTMGPPGPAPFGPTPPPEA